MGNHLTVLVGTPHYAKDLACALAGVEGKTFDALDQEERDRYYELAAWITDEYLQGDDFHDGCMPRDVHWDVVGEAFLDGYRRREEEALAAITVLAQNSGDAAKATLRLAYQAVRGTESGEAIRAKVSGYVQERKRDGD